MNRLLTLLLGPCCPHQCGERVYPRDLAAHLDLEHAGDPVITPAIRTAVREPSVAAAYLRRHTVPRKKAS